MSSNKSSKHHFEKMASNKKTLIMSVAALTASYPGFMLITSVYPEVTVKTSALMGVDYSRTSLFIGLIVTCAVAFFRLVHKLDLDSFSNTLMWLAILILVRVTNQPLYVFLWVILSCWISGIAVLYFTASRIINIELKKSSQRNVKTKILDSVYSWPGGFGFMIGSFAFKWRDGVHIEKKENRKQKTEIMDNSKAT